MHLDLNTVENFNQNPNRVLSISPKGNFKTHARRFWTWIVQLFFKDRFRFEKIVNHLVKCHQEQYNSEDKIQQFYKTLAEKIARHNLKTIKSKKKKQVTIPDFMLLRKTPDAGTPSSKEPQPEPSDLEATSDFIKEIKGIKSRLRPIDPTTKTDKKLNTSLLTPHQIEMRSQILGGILSRPSEYRTVEDSEDESNEEKSFESKSVITAQSKKAAQENDEFDEEKSAESQDVIARLFTGFAHETSSKPNQMIAIAIAMRPQAEEASPISDAEWD